MQINVYSLINYFRVIAVKALVAVQKYAARDDVM